MIDPLDATRSRQKITQRAGVIGVLAKEADYPVVREFFELFKTPWEFYRNDCQYEVVLCSEGEPPESAAKLVLTYGAGQKMEDQRHARRASLPVAGALLDYKGGTIPIYGKCVTFSEPGVPILKNKLSQEPAAVETALNGRKRVRVGFELFDEVRHLLTSGQPVANAEIPALELHIAVLRDLILGAAINLMEIPPVPAGYNLMVCLTHDVDHIGVRNHKCDHTMMGFLYRATIGSVLQFFGGRRTLRQLGANWAAALSLPFVHLGWAKDFWCQLDRYLQIEKGLNSTFFLIPNRNDPGQTVDGRRPRKRAASYDIADLAGDLRRLIAAGDEIGLHGIDAWRDSAKGREELARLSGVTGSPVTGSRMHWLFFDGQSPAMLEKAGLSYDSTVGYNETVGYRAGTTQVFRPLGLEKMMELPMHVMDTALFYPAYRNLSSKAAKVVVDALIDNAVKLGGVLTVNWHDRSIAPERLWDTFYIDLIDNLKQRGAWFPTASQAVAWFKMRRSVVMEAVSHDGGPPTLKVSVSADNSLPGMNIRIHAAETAEGGPAESFTKTIDMAFKEKTEFPLDAASLCLTGNQA